MAFERVMGYPSYTHSGYTFRGAVQDPKSWVRKLHRHLNECGTMTKEEFFGRYVPHIDLKTRRGWGTSIWSALSLAGFMKKTTYRRNRFVVMEKGPEFDNLDTLVKIFDKIGDKLEWEEINVFVDFFSRNTPHSVYVPD